MSKAYANRKQQGQRPEGDFYPTPRSLLWVAEAMLRAELCDEETVFEPCSGDGALSSELQKLGFTVAENDLYRGGYDYLEVPCDYRQVVTNPPFSLWDSFVAKAKREADKVIMIGRLNYFGTTSRLHNGTWDGLKSAWMFTRYVDYRTPERQDGLFHVGAMATAWFVWERGFTAHPTMHFLDVQKYARLGNK